LFSYWRSVPLSAPEMQPMREVLKVFDQKLEQGNLLLLREKS